MGIYTTIKCDMCGNWPATDDTREPWTTLERDGISFHVCRYCSTRRLNELVDEHLRGNDEKDDVRTVWEHGRARLVHGSKSGWELSMSFGASTFTATFMEVDVRGLADAIYATLGVKS